MVLDREDMQVPAPFQRHVHATSSASVVDIQPVERKGSSNLITTECMLKHRRLHRFRWTWLVFVE